MNKMLHQVKLHSSKLGKRISAARKDAEMKDMLVKKPSDFMQWRCKL